MTTESHKRRLLDLIGYVEAVEKDRLHTVTDVADHNGFRRDEQSLLNLPGVLNRRVDDDEPAWLWVDRLNRTPPPGADDKVLACWLVVKDDRRSVRSWPRNCRSAVSRRQDFR